MREQQRARRDATTSRPTQTRGRALVDAVAIGVGCACALAAGIVAIVRGARPGVVMFCTVVAWLAGAVATAKLRYRGSGTGGADA